MRIRTLVLPAALVALALDFGSGVLQARRSPVPSARAQQPATPTDTIRLPAPRAKGPLSLEEALASRRSVRQWAPGALTLEEASQLAWAAQGITGPGGHRTAPSAMARYPIELYLVADSVKGLPAGVYRYVPAAHGLVPVAGPDHRAAVVQAANSQASVKASPLVLVIAGAHSRIGARGEQTDRFVSLEAGAVLQNIYLQATSLHLGAVAVGGFRAPEMATALPLRPDEAPLIVVPVGRRQ